MRRFWPPGGCCAPPSPQKRRPWHDVGGQSPASHRRDRRSIPNQSMWNLWWINWEWDKFSSEYFSFPCQHHPTNAPYTSSSICFSCEKGTEREAWESNQESKALSEIGNNCLGKNVHFLFQRLNIARLILSRHTNYSVYFVIFFTDKRTMPPASLITPLFTLTMYKNHNIKMNLRSSMRWYGTNWTCPRQGPIPGLPEHSNSPSDFENRVG
jgi:hypothetical protein